MARLVTVTPKRQPTTTGPCTYTRRIRPAADVAQQLHEGLDDVSIAPGDELLDQRPVLRPTSQGRGED